MLHVCCNNEKKIGVKPIPGMKPGSNRNEIGHNRNEAKQSWRASKHFFGHYYRFYYVSNLVYEWLKFRDAQMILYASWLRSLVSLTFLI